MATTFQQPIDLRQDHKFFFVTSWIMAAVIVAGFATNLAVGRSSFSEPLIYHVHAFVFFGWLALYLMQNSLIFVGNVALHRTLGWLALLWLPVMVALGTALTIVSLRTHGGPFFFAANEFLFVNPLAVACFAGLASAAIVMRRRTDWHRRLMFCGMAVLTAPGSGRLLPMPLFIPWAWWVGLIFVVIFPIAGIVYDRRRGRGTHPAWLWGIGALLASQVVAEIIAYSPPGIAATRAILAGTPGDRTDLRAHLP